VGSTESCQTEGKTLNRRHQGEGVTEPAYRQGGGSSNTAKEKKKKKVEEFDSQIKGGGWRRTKRGKGSPDMLKKKRNYKERKTQASNTKGQR